MVKINQSIQNINNRMNFEGLDDPRYSVSIKRYQGFIGKVICTFINLFSKNVFLNVEDVKGNKTEVMVNVNSLAKRLGIAKNEIKEQAQKNNLEAFIEEKRIFIINERQKVLNQDEDELFSKYTSNQVSGLNVSDNYRTVQLNSLLNTADARALAKAIVTLKYATLTPNQSDNIETHLVILSGTRVHLIATPDKNNPTTNKITGLFGRILGSGGFGTAMRTTDAATLAETSGEETKDLGVLKLPNDANARNEVLSSAKVIADLHKLAGGKPEGIQDRIRIVTNKQTGDFGISSPHYTGSIDQIKHSDMTPLVIAHGFKQLCAGLAFMHKNNIAHRDIKPENVFVRRGSSENDWKFHLADFDLANYHNKTIDKRARGTPNYKGNNDWKDYEAAVSYGLLQFAREIDFQADIFALCLTLYSLATGDIYGRPDQIKLEAQIKDNNLCDLIFRGMSQDRTKRPSIKEIQNAVDRYYKSLA